jgi:hypothetical protein
MTDEIPQEDDNMRGCKSFSINLQRNEKDELNYVEISYQFLEDEVTLSKYAGGNMYITRNDETIYIKYPYTLLDKLKDFVRFADRLPKDKEEDSGIDIDVGTK